MKSEGMPPGKATGFKHGHGRCAQPECLLQCHRTQHSTALAARLRVLLLIAAVQSGVKHVCSAVLGKSMVLPALASHPNDLIQLT